MVNAFRYCRLVCIARFVACCLAYFYGINAFALTTYCTKESTNVICEDTCSKAYFKKATVAPNCTYNTSNPAKVTISCTGVPSWDYVCVIPTPTPTPTPPPPDKCKQNEWRYVNVQGLLVPATSAYMCFGGCVAAMVDNGGETKWSLCYEIDGKGYCEPGNSKYQLTGSKCTGNDVKSKDGNATTSDPDNSTPTPPPQSPEQQCISKGKSYGYVNGKVMCVEPTNGETVVSGDTSTSTTTTASGVTTTTTTTTTTKDNGDTVTTTTKNPDGTETSKTESKDSFCTDNPNATICKNSSVVGDCQTFKCEGDAITCEIAKVNWKQYCQFQVSENDPLVVAGNKAMGPDDGSIRNELAAGEFDLSGAIKQDRWIAGSCPADLVFEIMGQTVSMPISKLCPWLEMIGKLGVAICFIVCVMIVTGAKSGD